MGSSLVTFSELLKRIRHWLQRRSVRFCYVWVAELQQRGALHYHILVWLPFGLTLPKPDKQGWWPHGSTRIEWARHPIGYLVKYASKFDIKCGLPKGARLHGAGGFDQAAQQIRRWFNCPHGSSISQESLAALCELKALAWRIQIRGFACRRPGGCPAAEAWLRQRVFSST